MPWGKWGHILLWKLLFHDDGVKHHGGVNACLCGTMGSGKSTLSVQFAQEARYLPECSKDDYIDFMQSGKRNSPRVYSKPETVIYRAREYDHWTALIPQNWGKSYTNFSKKHFGEDPKPLNIFVHQDDDLVLCYKKGNEKIPIKDMPPVRKYRHSYDLLQMMDEGSINVVYEPTNYCLTEFLYKVLEEKQMCKIKRIEDTPVKSVVFWYELINTLLRDKPHDFYTLIIDEFHDIAEASPVSNMWHLQDVLAKSFLALRKQNISLIGSTHDFDLIDYRITHRFGFWLWLPGSIPSQKVSRVYRTVTSNMPIGNGVIEKKQERFDDFEFVRIFRQPPIVHCIDLKAEKEMGDYGEHLYQGTVSGGY